eukprot:2509287-Pyramimonas_sp.AAC.1
MLRRSKLHPIPGTVPLARKCNEGETAQLRSVAFVAAWFTRQCKPELLYRASRLQTAVRPR